LLYSDRFRASPLRFFCRNFHPTPFLQAGNLLVYLHVSFYSSGCGSLLGYVPGFCFFGLGVFQHSVLFVFLEMEPAGRLGRIPPGFFFFFLMFRKEGRVDFLVVFDFLLVEVSLFGLVVFFSLVGFWFFFFLLARDFFFALVFLLGVFGGRRGPVFCKVCFVTFWARKLALMRSVLCARAF